MGGAPAGDRVARRAIVSGRVQGVFFRDSVRRRAGTLRVAGWARNLPDGTVEVWAEGALDAVAALIEFARRGPPRAAVEGVVVEDVEPAGLDGFGVR